MMDPSNLNKDDDKISSFYKQDTPGGLIPSAHAQENITIKNIPFASFGRKSNRLVTNDNKKGLIPKDISDNKNDQISGGDNKKDKQAKKNNSLLKRTSTIAANLENESTLNEKLQKAILSYLENNYYIIFMCIVTFYALFSNDINIGFLPYYTDIYFDIISTIAFALFFVEIILSCYARENYTFSFFFWLDLISTLSLIMEIDFIFTPIMNSLLG